MQFQANKLNSIHYIKRLVNMRAFFYNTKCSTLHIRVFIEVTLGNFLIIFSCKHRTVFKNTLCTFIGRE